ncbi:hypothetical protein ABK249_33075 [Neorhizobium sp. Rsf11]|uniref:Uncharacterized protein n=1 Tax=Neorhizobium phenanthreniclasticum TaxID=3157917 RepID=A0ABV0MD40_9HYPH
MIKRSQMPLFDGDLAVCQQVFDEIRAGTGIARESEEGERIATIVVELYRQGIREPRHLKTMVQEVRGLSEKQLLQPSEHKP